MQVWVKLPQGRPGEMENRNEIGIFRVVCYTSLSVYSLTPPVSLTQGPVFLDLLIR